MITIDPQQELFTALLVALRDRFGESNVYDGDLPPEDTPYPFVYLGDSDQSDRPLKDAVHGQISQTIHVWNDDLKKRGTISKMLLEIKQICWQLEKTPSFGWMAVESFQRILPDSTTSKPLMHGHLQVTYKFS